MALRAATTLEPRGANIDPKHRLPHLMTARADSTTDLRRSSDAVVGRRYYSLSFVTSAEPPRVLLQVFFLKDEITPLNSMVLVTLLVVFD